MIKQLCNRRSILMAFIFAGLLMPRHAHAQNTDVETADPTDEPVAKHHKKKLPEPVYPKTVGYLSFIVPTGTLQNNKVTWNFTNNTKIGFPVGMNVLYSAH